MKRLQLPLLIMMACCWECTQTHMHANTCRYALDEEAMGVCVKKHFALALIRIRQGKKKMRRK